MHYFHIYSSIYIYISMYTAYIYMQYTQFLHNSIYVYNVYMYIYMQQTQTKLVGIYIYILCLSKTQNVHHGVIYKEKTWMQTDVRIHALCIYITHYNVLIMYKYITRRLCSICMHALYLYIIWMQGDGALMIYTKTSLPDHPRTSTTPVHWSL